MAAAPNGNGVVRWLGIPAAIIAVAVMMFWVVGTSYVTRTENDRLHRELTERVDTLEREVNTIQRDMQFCVSLARSANVSWDVCMSERLR